MAGGIEKTSLHRALEQLGRRRGELTPAKLLTYPQALSALKSGAADASDARRLYDIIREAVGVLPLEMDRRIAEVVLAMHPELAPLSVTERQRWVESERHWFSEHQYKERRATVLRALAAHIETAFLDDPAPQPPASSAAPAPELLAPFATIIAAAKELIPLVTSRAAALTLWRYASRTRPDYADELADRLEDDQTTKTGFVHLIRLLDAHWQVQESYGGRQFLRNHFPPRLVRAPWNAELGANDATLGPARYLIRQDIALDADRFFEATQADYGASWIYLEWHRLLHAPGLPPPPAPPRPDALARNQLLRDLWILFDTLAPFVPDEVGSRVDLESICDWELTWLVFDFDGVTPLTPIRDEDGFAIAARDALEHRERLWITHAPSVTEHVYRAAPAADAPPQFIRYGFASQSSSEAN